MAEGTDVVLYAAADWVGIPLNKYGYTNTSNLSPSTQWYLESVFIRHFSAAELAYLQVSTPSFEPDFPASHMQRPSRPLSLSQTLNFLGTSTTFISAQSGLRISDPRRSGQAKLTSAGVTGEVSQAREIETRIFLFFSCDVSSQCFQESLQKGQLRRGEREGVAGVFLVYAAWPHQSDFNIGAVVLATKRVWVNKRRRNCPAAGRDWMAILVGDSRSRGLDSSFDGRISCWFPACAT